MWQQSFVFTECLDYEVAGQMACLTTFRSFTLSNFYWEEHNSKTCLAQKHDPKFVTSGEPWWKQHHAMGLFLFSRIFWH